MMLGVQHINPLGRTMVECKHEWDNSILLLSDPPQKRCKKCGKTKYISEYTAGIDWSTDSQPEEKYG